MHIAVCGQKGVGKSTFIATVNGKKKEDVGRRNQEGRMVWYEISTAAENKEVGTGMFAFDAVVMLFEGDGVDERVMRGAVEFGVPVFLVRTKADLLGKRREEVAEGKVYYVGGLGGEKEEKGDKRFDGKILVAGICTAVMGRFEEVKQK